MTKWLVCIAALGIGLSGCVFLPPEAGSVGVIGGADGPTAVFVTTQGYPVWPTVLLLVAAIIGFLLWRRFHK